MCKEKRWLFLRKDRDGTHVYGGGPMGKGKGRKGGKGGDGGGGRGTKGSSIESGGRVAEIGQPRKRTVFVAYGGWDYERGCRVLE